MKNLKVNPKRIVSTEKVILAKLEKWNTIVPEIFTISIEDVEAITGGESSGFIVDTATVIPVNILAVLGFIDFISETTRPKVLRKERTYGLNRGSCGLFNWIDFSDSEDYGTAISTEANSVYFSEDHNLVFYITANAIQVWDRGMDTVVTHTLDRETNKVLPITITDYVAANKEFDEIHSRVASVSKGNPVALEGLLNASVIINTSGLEMYHNTTLGPIVNNHTH